MGSLLLPRLSLLRSPDSSLPMLALTKSLSRDRIISPFVDKTPSTDHHPLPHILPPLSDRPIAGGILIREPSQQHLLKHPESPPSASVSSASSASSDQEDGGDSRRRTSSQSATRASSARPKIRFAPLPDPRRPGIADGFYYDSDDADPLPGTPLHADAAALLNPGDIADDGSNLGSCPTSPLKARFSIDSFGNGSEYSTGTAYDAGPSSTATLKDLFLRPFGLAKKSKSGGAPLRKTQSLEAGSASGYFPKTSSAGGLGLRRTRTNDSCGVSDSGDTVRPQRKRAQYPPVAQRRPVHSSCNLPDVPEPKFVEWGVAQGVATSVAGSQKSNSGAHEEEDDGSGMAWLKKRRREREESAKRAAEEETTVDKGDETPTIDKHDGTANAVVNLDSEGAASDVASVHVEAGEEQESTISSTTSDSAEVTASDSPRLTDTPISDGPSDLEEVEEEEEEEDDPEREDDDDDDDDLDEEEMLREERLQAEAKASQGAAAAGKEVYRDHDHVKMLMKTKEPSRGRLFRRNTEMIRRNTVDVLKIPTLVRRSNSAKV